MKNAKSLVVPLVLLRGVFLLIKYESKKKSARMNDQSTNGVSETKPIAKI